MSGATAVRVNRECVDCGAPKPAAYGPRCRACWRSTSRPVRPLADRFWEKADGSAGPTGCWPWLGFKHHGWGRFAPSKGQSVGAHRMAVELARGPIPVGMHVDHLCRNRACVNPAHLEVVTQAENNRRSNAVRWAR